MSWYIGQPVVAVDNNHPYYKKGDEFKIKGIRESGCRCKGVELNVGLITSGEHGVYCDTCGVEENIGKGIEFYEHESNFAPLYQDISELTEILERELVNVFPPHVEEQKEKI